MTPRNKSTYKILVVDDDPSVLATYRRLLCRAGYETQAEADPTRVLANNNPAVSVDLLLIDYKMPGMDGLTLLAELRRRECKAPCILLSAFLNDDVLRQAKTLGVARVMEKPVDACALRKALNELLPVVGGRTPFTVVGEAC